MLVIVSPCVFDHRETLRLPTVLWSFFEESGANRDPILGPLGHPILSAADGQSATAHDHRHLQPTHLNSNVTIDMHARTHANQEEQGQQQADLSTSENSPPASAAAHSASAASPSLRAAAMHNAAAAAAVDLASSSPPTPLLLPKRGAASGTSSVDASGANTPNSLLSPLVVHRSVQGQSQATRTHRSALHRLASPRSARDLASRPRAALTRCLSVAAAALSGFGHGASMPSSRAIGVSPMPLTAPHSHPLVSDAWTGCLARRL